MARFVLLYSLLLAALPAIPLAPFGGDLGSQKNPVPGMPDFRAPYGDRARAWLSFDSATTADQSIAGTNFMQVLLWLPQGATEIGVRVLSPWSEKFPRPENRRGDAVEGGAIKSVARPEFFDPLIRLERSGIGEPRYLSDEKVRATRWTELASGDDDRELPPQPQGDRLNASARAVGADGKLLPRGLYRILITTSKTNAGRGSFFLEAGVMGKASNLVLSKTVAELARQASEIDRLKR
ncbi:MAG: hypothetical protein J0L75_16540 [Spirochaetes bacterium]|nr:hypothetical protein [Spirochaetota bacterium]